MKHEMRRKDRQLAMEDIEAILQQNAYGVLSIVGEDGYPYGLPISYAYEGGKLYFHHTTEKSMLGDYISGETKACFTVVGDTQVLPSKFSTKYESVIAFGKIKESTEKLDGLMRLVQNLSTGFEEQGRAYAEKALGKVLVYEFEIESVTGKARR